MAPNKKKRGPGRPKLPKGESKGTTLVVRMRLTERQLVERAAKDSNKGLSEYVRDRLMEGLQ